MIKNNMRSFYERRFILTFSLLLVLNIPLVVIYYYGSIWPGTWKHTVILAARIYESEEGIYKIKRVAGNSTTNGTSFVTVVTCMFRSGRETHSRENFEKWSTTMIKSMGSPLVAFVDVAWADLFATRLSQANLSGETYSFKLI